MFARLDRRIAGRKIKSPRTFVRNENGAVTVLVVIFFVLMIGFTGIVIDVGRIMNIHSQANSYVDRVALAAAAELDAEAGAMQRAVDTGIGGAQIIPTGFRLSLSGDNDIGIARMVFFSAITDDDMDPFARSPLAGDSVLCEWTSGGGIDCSASGLDEDEADRQASFVLIEASTETENFIMFPIAAALAPGLATQASVAPQALAGFRQEVCDIPPLAICNPNEAFGSTDFTPVPGTQILLKTKGPGAAWAAGNFGFLQLPAGSGAPNCSGPPNSANFQRCVLGLVNPNTRCISARVDTSPGQRQTVHVGLNTMFDIYDPPLQNNSGQNIAAFQPSANVTKGFTFNNCRTNPGNSIDQSADTVPLPRDTCFGPPNTCTIGDPNDVSNSGRIGTGMLNNELSEYWMQNHGAPLPADVTTRFEAYRFELDNDMVVDNPPKDEDGSPTCSPFDGIDNPVRDRRVLITAVINCQEHGVSGSSTDIPVEGFMNMFITEPIGFDEDVVPGSESGDIWGEVVSAVEPGTDDGILHEFPVLYR